MSQAIHRPLQDIRRPLQGLPRIGVFLLASLLAGAAGVQGVWGQDAPLANLTGNWAFEVVTENGTGYPTVSLTQVADSLAGFYVSERMGSRALVGRVKGDSILFQIETDPAVGVVMAFSGILRPDGTLAGIVGFGGMGEATFTARRSPNARAWSRAP
jgi:hypothetical protein